jgi:glycosyltransferase involved in cell wall biosynthesis
MAERAVRAATDQRGRAGTTANDERLSVLFVHTATQPPLGADTWVHLQIIEALDRSTHSVHVACVPATADGPTPTAERLADIDAVSVVPVGRGPSRPSDTSLRAIWRALGDAAGSVLTLARLVRYIRRNDISIVHTSDRPRDALLCVILSKLTRARSIVHLHVLYRDWMSRPLRWSITTADARIAVSEFVRRSLADGGAPTDDTYVVLNAIAPARWQPGTGRDEIRREFGIGPDVPVVVTACRLFAEKGTAELIDAIGALRSTIPDIQLLVVGHDTTNDQTFIGALRALVARLELDEHVHFTGRRPDVDALMAAADVFAMPSFEEPFGLVFAEAMAMEVPVVALDNGGTKEVVTNGVDGLLSAPGDAAGLVDNLRTLLTDPDLRRRMGTAGRQQVEERFTIGRMAADTGEVYRSVTQEAVGTKEVE